MRQPSAYIGASCALPQNKGLWLAPAWCSCTASGRFALARSCQPVIDRATNLLAFRDPIARLDAAQRLALMRVRNRLYRSLLGGTSVTIITDVYVYQAAASGVRLSTLCDLSGGSGEENLAKLRQEGW